MHRKGKCVGNPYSSEKMVWWYAREGKLPDVPKQVELILSDLCNQNCSFCAYRLDGYSSNQLFMGESEASPYGKNNPKRWIPTDRALSLLEEFKRAGVLGVQYTGGGEPSVHPHHEQVFIRTLELGLKAALVSNGYRWSSSLVTDILPWFSWVRVSVDAGTEETYRKIRETGKHAWERVWENIRGLANVIKNRETGCILGIGWVATPQNYHEILEGVRLCAESGADYVRMSAMFSQDGAKPYEAIYGIIKQRLREAKDRYESDRFKVYDLFGDRLQDLVDGPPDYETCSYQHYTHYIGGDLQAYRCCVLAYNERGKVAGGNLKDRAFDEWWSSEERKQDFAKFDARGCDRCQFNNKNRAMVQILKPDITHKEFP
jgi:MoaA/NifB/PqqE/SkfB family radical SAM enzyme